MKNEATNVLRPFTKNDWSAFLGCESEFPEICYGPDWVLILDGSSLGACLDGPNDVQRHFNSEFSSPDAARAIAGFLLSLHHVPSMASTLLEEC
jgi:hypothetical protein